MGRVWNNLLAYAVVGFVGITIAGVALLCLGGLLFMIFSVWYAVFSFFG